MQICTELTVILFLHKLHKLQYISYKTGNLLYIEICAGSGLNAVL